MTRRVASAATGGGAFANWRWASIAYRQRHTPRASLVHSSRDLRLTCRSPDANSPDSPRWPSRLLGTTTRRGLARWSFCSCALCVEGQGHAVRHDGFKYNPAFWRTAIADGLNGGRHAAVASPSARPSPALARTTRALGGGKHATARADAPSGQPNRIRQDAQDNVGKPMLQFVRDRRRRREKFIRAAMHRGGMEGAEMPRQDSCSRSPQRRPL